jgi:MoaA/NifB/PqqE/SkfB family radical SAM enzyme
MTIARHNAHQLTDVLQLARDLGADALPRFLLVPVDCGIDIAAEQMVPPEEYERMLNWFYDQSLVGASNSKRAARPTISGWCASAAPPSVAPWMLWLASLLPVTHRERRHRPLGRQT